VVRRRRHRGRRICRLVEQFADYEQWLATSHPEVYAQAFRDRCCSGSADGMLLTRESIAAQETVIDEWATGP
jgi:hypothetical protein